MSNESPETIRERVNVLYNELVEINLFPERLNRDSDLAQKALLEKLIAGREEINRQYVLALQIPEESAEKTDLLRYLVSHEWVLGIYEQRITGKQIDRLDR